MTLEDTLIFATALHRGQVDKAGQPYILHPLRVLNNLGLNAPLEHQMAALLHDVMEDCGVTRELLEDQGFPEAVIVAVEHLTKNAEGEADYDKAIDRVMLNPIAVKVKLADLTDNMDTQCALVKSNSKMPSPHPKKLLRFCAYWRKRVETVGAQLVEHFGLTKVHAQVHAQDLWHFQHRLIRKILAHTVAVFLNLKLARPPLQLEDLVSF